MYFFEGVAAITATACYYKYKHLPIRLIVVLLWTAILTEIVAYTYSHYVYPNNHWVYNLYSFLFYLLIFKMIYDHIENKTRRTIVAFIYGFIITLFIIRALTTPVITRFMTNVHNIAMVCVVIALLYYAIDRLKSNEPLQPKKELELFVFGAYLFFGICFVPISWFRMGQMGTSYSETFHLGVSIIQGVVLILTNALLIFGLLWTRPSNDFQNKQRTATSELR